MAKNNQRNMSREEAGSKGGRNSSSDSNRSS
ncbi:hypothetical protein J2Z58_002369 [Halobacillus andaensis]|nr:hypothetical protein [Halobacillus andaensis]